MAETQQTGDNQPGYYNIERIQLVTVTGISVDIHPHMESLVIYEDIYSPFLSGVLLIQDTQDLLGSFGRFGFNVLNISIKSTHCLKENEIDHNFHVYSITDMEDAAQRYKRYRLNFISEEGIGDLKTHSRAFAGKPEKIVEEIVANNLLSDKEVISEPTSNEIRFVSPYWFPQQIIDFICTRQRTQDHFAYVFFENRKGFNFTTLEKLADNKEFRPFEEQDHNTQGTGVQSSNTVTDQNLQKAYRKILEYRLIDTHDYLKMHENGSIKSRMLVNDPLLKTFRVLADNNISGNPTKMNSSHFYDPETIKLSAQRHMRMTKFYSNYSRGESQNFQNILKRITKTETFRTFNIEMEVYGNMDYMAGDKIRCQFIRPAVISEEMTNNDQRIDKLRTGFYLIGSIAHRFGTAGYFCTMQLIKDSTELA